MKRKIATVASLLVLSGVAIACTTKPMPFLGVIDVSVGDMVGAWFDDYQNPARAAMLGSLDERAAMLVGADNWKRDNYVGHVTYDTPFDVGHGIVYTDKPCGEEAIDATPKEGESGSGGNNGDGTSGGGGDYWGYVLEWSMSQDWASYEERYGEVGEITPINQQ